MICTVIALLSTIIVVIMLTNDNDYRLIFTLLCGAASLGCLIYVVTGDVSRGYIITVAMCFFINFFSTFFILVDTI